MKKFLLVIFLCAGILTVKAQTESIWLNSKMQPDKFLPQSRTNLTAGKIFVNDSTYGYTWDTQGKKWSAVNGKAKCIYSKTGKLTQKIVLSLVSGKWQNISRVLCTYYATDTLQEYLEQNWNTTKNAWGDTTIFTKYRADSKIIEEINKTYDPANPANIQGTKDIYTYDSNGILTVTTTTPWSTTTKNWSTQKEQSLLTYSNDGFSVKGILPFSAFNLISLFDSSEDLNTSFMSLASFEGKISSELTQTWDINKVKWIDKERSTHLKTDTASVMLTEVWDAVKLKWISSERTSFKMNQKGKLVGLLSQTWDAVGNMWIDDTYYTFIYDSSDRLSTMNISTWDTQETAWSLSRISFTYDTQGRISTTILQADILFGWVNLMKTINSYNSNGNITSVLIQNFDLIPVMFGGTNDWVNNSKTDYYWSQITTGIRDVAKNPNFAIPNPYLPDSRIECTTNESTKGYRLEIYNLSGSLVFTRNFDGNSVVTINKPLNEGLYIAGIRNNLGLLWTQKLFIKNL